MPPVAPKQPPGTFLPGTKVQVGNQRVVIDRYLSEGGFAHVYVVRLPRDGQIAVLKRVAVPDKEHLAHMRTEVETMKKLKGHHKVVTYMDSHASQLKGGGYEVFLLMEFCSGGGLIDFMNTRLQHRLTEPEILKIFGDVAEGLACMHYLRPPLLHRDLKVENVLISKPSGSGTPTYKLCDFGSAASPRPAAKTAEEGRLIEEDVQKNTTMQYRSPEMIDVWRKQPIDEKADIWALGVFLYKLCYYTTPFEDVGQMAILNASYKFPSYPSFTPRLRKLISSMLMEDPKARPNVYQVIKEVCSMRGTEVPIKDIYANRTASEARRNESLPSSDSSSSMIGLQKTAPQAPVQTIPDIAPMRRGRPTAPSQQTPATAKSTSSATPKGDPFAALDSKNYETRVGAVDELSKRFPSLDEFTIAHDTSGPFQFSSDSGKPVKDAKSSAVNDRVAQALADEVFAQTTSKSSSPRPSSVSQTQSPVKAAPEKPKPLPKVPIVSPSPTLMHQPTPVRPGNRYKSTGVGSSPPPVAKPKLPPISNRPIWKVPDHHRSSSQPRASLDAEKEAALLKPGLPNSERPALHEIHRSKSQTATLAAAKSPTSSRPSLEGHRPSTLDINDSSSISRAKSAQNRSRPTSMYTNSNMDYLRDQESSSRNSKRPSMEMRRSSRQPSQSPPEEANIENDMEYLRKTSDTHKKRSSLGSLSGAKQMIAGRFGDAFKRFERDDQSALKTPDPVDDNVEPAFLSPIKGSEGGASPRRSGEEFNYNETETEDLPPHVKRELERRRLSQEERRVADAAAEYRARVAAQGAGESAPPPSRANTIQQRVQSLLDEGRQAPPPKKTAEGYGRYTATPEPVVPGGTSAGAQMQQPSVPKASAPPVARKPPTSSLSLNNSISSKPKVQSPSDIPTAGPGAPLKPSTSAPQPAPAAAITPQPSARPSVPLKSANLRTGGSAKWPPSASDAQPTNTTNAPSTAPSDKPHATGLAALLAKDLEGVPDYPPRGSSLEGSAALNKPKMQPPAKKSSAQEDLLGLESESVGVSGGDGDADPEKEFSKRFPSLSGFELT